MSDRYQDGAFAFYRARGVQPMDPETVRSLAEQLGLTKDIVPAYAGDRMTVSRAIGAVSSHVSKSGWLLRPIKQARAEVVYGIVQETRHPETDKVDHVQAGTLSWQADRADEIVSGHPIGHQVEGAYTDLRGKIIAPDWTGCIASYLLGDCQATPMRDDGRIYWIPPQTVDKARTLGNLLDHVGISLVLCEIEAEAKATVTEAAGESLYEALDALEAEAAAFDGTQKPSTYQKRLEEYAALRQRATLYHDALNVGVSKAQAVLDRLEAEVGQMLDIRRQTTIKRGSGDAGGQVIPPAAADADVVYDDETPDEPSAVAIGFRPPGLAPLPTIGQPTAQATFNW